MNFWTAACFDYDSLLAFVSVSMLVTNQGVWRSSSDATVTHTPGTVGFTIDAQIPIFRIVVNNLLKHFYCTARVSNLAVMQRRVPMPKIVSKLSFLRVFH